MPDLTKQQRDELMSAMGNHLDLDSFDMPTIIDTKQVGSETRVRAMSGGQERVFVRNRGKWSASGDAPLAQGMRPERKSTPTQPTPTTGERAKKPPPAPPAPPSPPAPPKAAQSPTSPSSPDTDDMMMDEAVDFKELVRHMMLKD